jgi:DNA-binding transcriptional LysR family regulator
MYPGIELRLQRYAVVLAEELNFTRAAERVHVAQASL